MSNFLNLNMIILVIFLILTSPKSFANSSWTIESNWDFNLTHPQFKASSVDAVNKCRLNPDSLLSFPVLLYGAHEIFLDNKSILKYGDPTFTNSNFVVGSPELKCQDLIQGKELKWIATAYSASFVKTLQWPVYHKNKMTNQFFAVDQYIGGIVGLFFVALFSFFIMYRKERTEFIIAFLGACLFISIYMIGCISPLLTNNLSMLMVHKISDISLGIGNTFLFTAFFLEKQITKRYIYFQYFSQMTGSVISLLGANGDIVQFGSTIQFISAILILIKILTANIKQLKSHYSLEYLFKGFSSVVFTFFTIYEMLFFTGLTNGPSLLPIGMICSFLILILSINEKINQTYTDLAYLKNNLESEVANKTKELESKSLQLINQANEKYQLSKQFTQVAQRTAHDIRSPLTTINYVAKKIHQTNPEDGKSLMLMSKQLIDIANDLLNYNKNNDLIGDRQSEAARFTEMHSVQNQLALNGNLANDLYLERFNLKAKKNPTSNAVPLSVVNGLPKFHSDEVYQILTEVVEMKKIELEQSDLRISVYNDLEKPGSIQFDRSQFMRIISNVINNANEAIITRPGMISISISNHLIDDVEYIAIEIRDNGPGFPAEVIQRLGQAGNTSGKENGHGIGLASAYETMQSWGARLAVSNIKPTGAKVSLMFIVR